VAFVLDSQIFLQRAVGEWNVVVGNVVEKVDFLLGQEKTGSNGVYRGIAPSFVEEAPVFVKTCEEVNVGVRTKPVQVANLKVGPLVVLAPF